MSTIKRFLFIMLAAFIVFIIVGCGGTKIELSFDQQSYEVEVGKEIDLIPTIKNENNEDYVLVFSSNEDEIATYKDGKVKGIAVGEVVVRVTLKDNEKVFAETTIEVFEVEKFNVTFDSNEGTKVATVVVEDGNKLAKPTDPTKAGHIFVGWYTDSTLRTPYNFNLVVKSNLTLYAKWDVAKYNVTFEVNGGSEVESIGVNFGEKVNKPENPTKEHHKFDGWFIDEDFSNAYDFNLEITEDLTLYAKWKLNSYTVLYNSEGGTSVDSEVVFYGEVATEPTAPTREGFEFVGWFRDTNKTEAFDFSEQVTQDMMLFAKWKLDELEGKLVVKGGNIVDLDVILNPKANINPKTQELGFFNDGYNAQNAETSIFLYEGDHLIFAGDGEGKEPAWWGYKVALTQIGPNTFVVEKNIGNEQDVPVGVYDYILVGLWRPNTYTGFAFVQTLVAGEILEIDGVDFEAEGSAVEATITKYTAQEIDYYYEFTVKPGAQLPTPTKVGFLFEGWCTNSAFTGDAVTEITENTTTTTFYAKWKEEVRLEISFDTLVEDLAVYPIYRLKGQVIRHIPNPVREGFEFIGWYIDEDLTELFDFTTQLEEEITLYAKWVEVVE